MNKNITNILLLNIVVLSALLLMACDADQPGNAKPSSENSLSSVLTPAERVTDKARLNKGQALYTKNCSRCHGAQAQGTLQWKTPGPDGKYPPPPLNGSAHAWHHPTEVLLEVIKDGTIPEGNMPAWEGKMTDDELKAVISWFQTLWSDDIFKLWQNLDLESRQE